MKDHLLQTLSDVPTEKRRNLAREYLQVYILRLLHEIEAPLAFVGGTTLRLVHGLPRFSEDLDASLLSGLGHGSFVPTEMFRQLKLRLERAGYAMTARMSRERSVANAFYRFKGLPRELQWSRDPRIALTIKVEVDTAPPAGARTEVTLIQRFFPIALRHHDLPSLFAGKVHALLARPYAKGRDWFDLVWYLTEHRGIEPNKELLASALAQTGHAALARRDWRQTLVERLRAIDWSKITGDLRPFVERQSDLDQLVPALIEKLLRSGHGRPESRISEPGRPSTR